MEYSSLLAKKVMELINEGKLDNAEQEISLLDYELPSNHPAKLFLKSILRIKQKKIFEAYKMLLTIERKNPGIALELGKALNISDAEFWNELGEIYSSVLSNVRAAEVCYVEAIKYNPRSVLPYIGLAFLYDDLGEKEKVENIISLLKERNSLNVHDKIWFLILLGSIEEKKDIQTTEKPNRLFKEAIKHGRKIALNTKLALLLGALALKLGDIKVAERFLEKAVKDDPKNQYAWGLLAIVSKIKKDYKKLLECLDNVVENEIEPAEVWIDLILRYSLPQKKE